MLFKFLLACSTVAVVVDSLAKSCLTLKMSIAGKELQHMHIPVRESSELRSSIIKLATVAPLATALILKPTKAFAADTVANTVTSPLGSDAYTDLGGMKMCKILTGMWQVSGAHGYEPQKQSAVAEMSHCAGKQCGETMKHRVS